MALQRATLAVALLGLATLAEPADREALKRNAAEQVDELRKLTQEMVDSIFSFGELGFQEVETSRYVTAILEEHGFAVERGLSGMPTAWVARWGSGKPVISLGSDIDGIPKASQKPGVAFHDPLVEGAPGHGEGHNSGQAVNVTAALVLKRIMERESLPGTLVLWPGVAEELVGAKAYFARDGLFADADAVFFTHVDDEFKTSWGGGRGSGLISVEYTFRGESAHSAGSPWRGRSALDAVELMNTGWNFRREHLRTLHRSHYIITGGGDQPNVVPQLASVWYYFREVEADEIRKLFEIGNRMADGAALMTDTSVSRRILGSAWPRHFNRPLAEALDANIRAVGMPEWSEADVNLAKALQRELEVDEDGLATEAGELEAPPEDPISGGSDDIGDVSWVAPTVTLRFPSNIVNLPGHNWANAVSMATPIAHKGATAGATALAMTVLDVLLDPELVTAVRSYFEEQTAELEYHPFVAPEDEPAVHLNAEKMEQFAPLLRPYYYDPDRFDSYLEQLGIEYPTVKE